MKEVIKTTENLEFDVIYADGTKKHVKEGILFEACSDNSTILHIGTHRQEVYMAYINGAIEFANDVMKEN